MTHTPLTPLRLGFIGGALNSAVGYTHFNSSRLDGHFRVDSGCFSRHPEQNQETARIYGVVPERNYGTWQELLSREKGNIDAIVVLTPTPDHSEIVIAALHAGYPVICEKALAVLREATLPSGEKLFAEKATILSSPRPEGDRQESAEHEGDDHGAQGDDEAGEPRHEEEFAEA